jgi:hypothetical protein
MNKLIKVLGCILFAMAIGYKTFGQVVAPYPIQRLPRRRIIVQQYPYQRIPYQPVYPNGARIPKPVLRIEQVKENFIGRQLNLSPQEARAFWPLYRQYVQEQTAVKILKRQNNSVNSPNGTQQVDRELEYEEQLVEIRRHYRDEFLKILPPEKVSLLYKSERQFTDEMLKQLSERNTVRAGN